MNEFKRETKAFPSTYVAPDESKIHYFGMDLRDYFAAKALNGLLSAELNAWRSGAETYDEYLEDLTSSAYLMADAMMEARK